MKMKLQIIAIFMTCFLGFSFVTADFSVTVGNVYTYEVIRSQQRLVAGGNIGEGTGLMFGGNPYPVGLTFTIEVVSTTATSVDWEIDVNGTTAINSNSAAHTASLDSFLFLPYHYYGGIGTWDQAEVEMGPVIVFPLFFLEPTAFGAAFQDYHDTVTDITPMSYWVFNDIYANYDDSNQVAVFDWAFNAIFNDTGCNMYFVGTFYATIAYDQTTGVLMGYNFEHEYYGWIGVNSLEIVTTQQIELEGYDLNELLYSPGLGFDWLIAIPTLGVVGIVGTIIRKRNK
ncbi:MAG: choice-of-anchor S family protein [Candidatus Heimdallarchaeota archaeon]